MSKRRPPKRYKGHSPDVIVTAIAYGDSVFTSTVKNQGGAPTPTGVYVDVAYYVDDIYRTSGRAMGPLAPGASIMIGTDGPTYSIPGGSHTITARVNDVTRFYDVDDDDMTINITI